MIVATLTVSLAGGILYFLLQFPVGYFIAPVLFGFVLATRGTIANVQRQTLLNNQTLDLAAQVLDARDRHTEPHSGFPSWLAASATISGSAIARFEEDRHRQLRTLTTINRLAIAHSTDQDMTKLHRRGALREEPGFADFV